MSKQSNSIQSSTASSDSYFSAPGRSFYLKCLLVFATAQQALSSSNQTNITALNRSSIMASGSLDEVSVKSFINDFNTGKIYKDYLEDSLPLPIQPNVDQILIKTEASDLQKELPSDVLRFLAEYIRATLIETKHGSRPSFSEIMQPSTTDLKIANESLNDAISFFKLSAQKLIQENKFDYAIDDYLCILSIKNEISDFDSQITGRTNQQVSITVDNAIKELIKDHKYILTSTMINNSPMLLEYLHKNQSPQPSPNIKPESSKKSQTKSSQNEL